MKFADLNNANINRAAFLSKDENQTTPGEWGNGLAGEYGEVYEAFHNFMLGLKVCNTLKKKLREAVGDPSMDALNEQLQDEIGDIVISLDLLCNSIGFNLGECVKNKFNKTSRKRNAEIYL